MFKVKLPQFVEVETHSFCNRSCSWCPNGWSDRSRKKDYISNDIWKLILRELHEVHYSGWFAFHNFNEPLTDPTIFDKIEEVRKKLSFAKLHLFTNGDLLTNEVLNRLSRLGVNKIRITLYPSSNKILDEPEKERIIDFVSRLELSLDTLALHSKRHLNGYLNYRTTQLHFIAPRIEKHYRTRAGSVSLPEISTHKKRKLPCHLPYRTASIDYLGNLKLCSEIYNTEDKFHSNYVIGNVADEGFLNLWFSERMNEFRKLTADANFDNLIGCQSCTFQMPQDRLDEMTVELQ